MKIIKKDDLANELVNKNNLKKKDAIKYINDIFESINENLKEGNKIELYGMFSIETKNVPLKTGTMNSKSKTGEIIKIPYTTPEHKKIKIKISKILKENIE